MARTKSSPEAVRAKSEVAERIRAIRAERFGGRGGPELARRLGLPIRTWYNYEVGVTVPAEVLLRFIELTGVEPLWLLHGRGPKYRAGGPARAESTAEESPGEVTALLRRALELIDRDDTAELDPPIVDRGPERVPEDDEIVIVRIEDPDAERGTGDPVALPLRRDWIGGARRCLWVRGDAMAPILADGALVGVADRTEEPEALDGALVVAQVDDLTVVRRLQHAGQFVLLRAENPAAEPPVIPVELGAMEGRARFRRVLWACTPHADEADAVRVDRPALP